MDKPVWNLDTVAGCKGCITALRAENERLKDAAETYLAKLVNKSLKRERERAEALERELAVMRRAWEISDDELSCMECPNYTTLRACEDGSCREVAITRASAELAPTEPKGED